MSENTNLIKRAPTSGDKISPGKTPLGELSDETFDWDYPPPYFEPVPLHSKRNLVKSTAVSRKLVTTEPNFLNEASGYWDFGDISIWAAIIGMSLLGLAIAVAAFALPHGTDAIVPPIKVY